jgi:pimeloyl-ACP methyl ester carboxylesterase
MSTMRRPTTQFAKAGEVHVGYQVFGEGPSDLLWIWGLASNVEAMWDEPSSAAFLHRLGDLARVIMFDRRGAGVSDREGTAATPTLEERVDDVIAVLDAVGCERVTAFGVSEGGAMAAALAASRPDRIDRIVVYGTSRFPRGVPPMDAAAWIEELASGWGTLEGAKASVHSWAPSMAGDDRFVEWMARQRRLACSRAAIRPLLWTTLNAYTQVDDLFRAVHVPALVVRRRDDQLAPETSVRLIAEEIPSARYVELPGADHYPFLGDTDALLAEIGAFIGGGRDLDPRDRRVLTIAAVETAATPGDVRLGEDGWRQLLASHADLARTYLARFGGRVIVSTGGTLLAAFDGPARAIRAAVAIVDGAERLGLPVRAGLHTGECELDGDGVHGLALHVATQISTIAAPGEILVSGTVRDLVAGSGIRFGEGRAAELEGLAGARPLVEVLRHGAHPDTVRRFAIEHANVLRLDGEYWTIAFDAHVVTVRDSKGMRDLAHLLAAPGRDHHVLDLASPGARHVVGHERGAEVLDATARADYKRRLTALQAEIDEAHARGDGVTVERIRATYDAFVDQLTSAYGLGGRSRRAPDAVERARKAVARRLRDAQTRIARAHPSLGRHLQASVRTGVFCSYAPERDVTWTVEADTR